MKHRRIGWILLAFLVAAAIVAAVLLLPTRGAATLASEAPKPSVRLTAAAANLDDITIDATLDPERSMLVVSQTLRLVNRTGQAVPEPVLRAYPNAFRSEDYAPAAIEAYHALCYPDGFSEGWLQVQSVECDGYELDYAYELDNDRVGDARTVLRVCLRQDWQPNAELTLSVRYVVKIPDCAYRFGRSGGVYALGNALLIPAAFTDGEFFTKEYYPIGDPFVSECRNYSVRLTVPKGYVVGASAYAAPVANGDALTYTFEALAVRDFALCVSDAYTIGQRTSDGVLVTALATDDQKAQRMLDVACRALKVYGERFGAYPYPAYTLCEIDFPMGGMEYPGMVMLSGAGLAGDSAEWLIAHETAHQWWYAVVGSDEYRQAWQDEALCEYSALVYFEAEHGAAARDSLRESRMESAMRVTVPEGVTIGSPVDYFGDMQEYSLVVYQRGGAMLCALDTALAGRLDEFLANYYDTYAFAIASRADFEALLAAFSGEDWSPLLTDYLDTYI